MSLFKTWTWAGTLVGAAFLGLMPGEAGAQGLVISTPKFGMAVGSGPAAYGYGPGAYGPVVGYAPVVPAYGYGYGYGPRVAPWTRGYGPGPGYGYGGHNRPAYCHRCGRHHDHGGCGGGYGHGPRRPYPW